MGTRSTGINHHFIGAGPPGTVAGLLGEVPLGTVIRLQVTIWRISLDLDNACRAGQSTIDEENRLRAYRMEQADFDFIMTTVRAFPILASCKFPTVWVPDIPPEEDENGLNSSFLSPFALLLIANAPLRALREVHGMFPEVIKWAFVSADMPCRAFPLTMTLTPDQKVTPRIQFLLDSYPQALTTKPGPSVLDAMGNNMPRSFVNEPDIIQLFLQKDPSFALAKNDNNQEDFRDLFMHLPSNDPQLPLVINSMEKALLPDKHYVFGSLHDDCEFNKNELLKIGQILPRLKGITIVAPLIDTSHLICLFANVTNNQTLQKMTVECDNLLHQPGPQPAAQLITEIFFQTNNMLKELQIVSKNPNSAITTFLPSMAKGLRQNKTLKALRLHGMNIEHSYHYLALDVLSHESGLRKLKLSACQWPETEPRNHTAALPGANNHKLKQLWIMDATIPTLYLPRILHFAAEKLRSLQSLRIQICPKADAEGDQGTTAAGIAPQDLDVTPHLLALLTGAAPIKLLEIGNMTVQANDLFEALKTNTTLTHLKCSGITGEHGQSIVDLLKNRNFTLQHIGAPEGWPSIEFQPKHAAKIDFYTGLNAHGRVKVNATAEDITVEDLVSLLCPPTPPIAEVAELEPAFKTRRVDVPNYEDDLEQASTWHTHELNGDSLRFYFLQQCPSLWSHTQSLDLPADNGNEHRAHGHGHRGLDPPAAHSNDIHGCEWKWWPFWKGGSSKEGHHSKGRGSKGRSSNA